MEIIYFFIGLFIAMILWGLLSLAVVVVGICSLIQRQNLFKNCAGYTLFCFWLIFTIFGLILFGSI